MIHQPCGLECQQARLLDVHSSVGNDIDIASQFIKWPAKRLARYGSLTQQLKCFFRGTNRAHTVMNTARAEAPLGYFKTTAGPQNNIVFWHSHIVELHAHMAVGGIEHIEDFEWPYHFDTRGFQRHQNL